MVIRWSKEIFFFFLFSIKQVSLILDPKFNAKTDGGRDVFYQGDVDDGCLKLAELLGWKNDLDLLIQSDLKESSEKANL